MFHAQFIWNLAFWVFTAPVSENMLFVIIALEQRTFFFFTTQRCNSTPPSAWLLFP